MDDSQGRISASNSIAEDTFFAQGILDQEETDVNSISVSPPIKTRFSVRQPMCLRSMTQTTSVRQTKVCFPFPDLHG